MTYNERHDDRNNNYVPASERPSEEDMAKKRR